MYSYTHNLKSSWDFVKGSGDPTKMTKYCGVSLRKMKEMTGEHGLKGEG